MPSSSDVMMDMTIHWFSCGAAGLTFDIWSDAMAAGGRWRLNDPADATSSATWLFHRNSFNLS